LTDVLNFSIDNGVANLVLNRPPYNPLHSELIQRLSDALTAIEAREDIHTVILSGEGDKAFCAGADINGFLSKLGTRDQTISGAFHQVCDQLNRLPVPIIAVLKGYVLGGGMELALACDLRISEEDTRFALPEINLGIFPGGGGTQRLPRLIGTAKALEMIWLGDAIDASEAKALALVNRVVAKGEGLQEAELLAARLKEKSRPVLSRIKKAILQGMDRTLREGLEIEQQLFSELFLLKDAKEGVEAFLEKRPPRFTHK
jgi:enoyl-CoA hydratase/carnithine racemase